MPRVTDDDINKMKAPDVKKLLKKYASELQLFDEVLGGQEDGKEDGENTPLNLARLFCKGIEEIKALKAQNEIIKAECAGYQTLKNEYDILKETVQFQQRTLERLDAKERSTNVVLMGIEEDKELEGSTTDMEKCKKVFSQIECDAENVVEVKRLGKETDARKKRPLLVVLNTSKNRDEVLTSSSKLKEKAPVVYKDIYIKKDLHPAVRREWGRLHEVKTTEQNRPENAGCQIVLDFKKREVTRDGVVIDKWSPTYFRQQGLNK